MVRMWFAKSTLELTLNKMWVRLPNPHFIKCKLRYVFG